MSDETKRKIGEKAKERFKNKTKHPMFGKHFSDESKLKMSNAQKGKRVNETSKRWKGYVNKDILIDCIKNDMIFINIVKQLKTSQKIIARSLLYHFNTKNISLIKLILISDKNTILNDILNNSLTNMYIKYKTNQTMFEKLLTYYFNTSSVVKIREDFKE